MVHEADDALTVIDRWAWLQTVALEETVPAASTGTDPWLELRCGFSRFAADLSPEARAVLRECVDAERVLVDRLKRAIRDLVA